MKTLAHFISKNLTVLLLVVSYLLLSAASAYAFFATFGWWCLVFAAVALFTAVVSANWFANVLLK